MKKTFFVFIGSFWVCCSMAADWDLFPLNQKTFYQYKNYFQVNNIHEILLDSVFTSGNNTTSFFLRKYQGTAHGNCYDQIIDFNPYPLASGNAEMDSLLQSNDTVYFPGYHKILYFIPGAYVGQMWNSHDSIGSNGFSDLHITCSSVQVETFLGITDSVKTFLFSGYNANVHYPCEFDTLVVKLSQHYGLIQYVPFNLIRDHSISYQYYHNIAGIQSASANAGFSAPSYSRFFPYHPGDILNWQYVGACSTCHPPVIIYSRDSITQVNFDPDTFSYRFWEWSVEDTMPVQLDTNKITKYAVADLTNIFESPPNWIAIAQDIFGIGSAANPRFEIYNSNPYQLNIIGNDTVVNYSFYLTGLSVDTTNCVVNDVPDATFTLKATTSQGVTETCYDSFGPMCTYLIGSIILGDTVGSTDLAVGTSEIISMEQFTISPNPAESSFTIKTFSRLQNSTIEIFNLLGDKIYSAAVCRLQTIDCRLFSPGIYLVKLQLENSFAVQKLIVE